MSAETRDTVGVTPGGAVPAEGAAVQVPKAPATGAARESGRPHRRVGLASLRGATDLVLRFQTAFGLVAVLVAGVVFSPIVKGQNVSAIRSKPIGFCKATEKRTEKKVLILR